MNDGTAIVAGLVGAYGLLVLHGPGYFNHFPVDDAFITFRYSQHLAGGHGPNWNSTGHVEGYTSFAWMALLAAISKLGIGIITAARTLAYLAALGTMGIVVAIWWLWSRENDAPGLRSPLVPTAALLSIAILDGVAYWGFSGMETALYVFVLTSAAFVAMREQRAGGPPYSAVAFAAVAMTRPEGIVAAAVTGFFTLNGIQRPETRQRALVRAALWSSTFFVLFGAYFAWRYTYYGDLLPNTYYAKAARTLPVYERGLTYLFGNAEAYHLVPALAGVALLSILPQMRRDAAYVGTLTCALLLSTVPEGGDAFGHGRMIVPVLPLLYLAAIAGFAVALARLRLEPFQRAAMATVLLSAMALLLLRASDNPYIPQDRRAQADRKALGLWLAQNTPQDFTVAAWAVGGVAYYDQRDTLDLFGLNDKTIARTKVPGFGTGIAGHERYNVDYVVGVVRPEIIVTGDSVEAPIADTAAFWQFYGSGQGLPARAAVLADPRLREMYTPRTVRIDGRWFQFLQRDDTIVQFRAPGLLNADPELSMPEHAALARATTRLFERVTGEVH